MDKQKDSLVEERALGFVALCYYAVLLVGFVIGLYGFFSLLWMAGSLVERNNHIAGSLF
jgi:nitrate reductase NapE component